MMLNMSSFFLCLSSLLIHHLVVAEGKGFSIKAIHRDSPESPLYPGNLTLEQKIERLHEEINSYIHRMPFVMGNIMNNQSSNADPAWIRPPVVLANVYYMAVMAIGTFDPPRIPYEPTYLCLDTGSELIWTQCENCRQCFPQTNPLYPYTHSKSFRLLPCSHRFAYPGLCEDNKSIYRQYYAYEATSEGYLASERFTFHSHTGGSQAGELVFGCGYEQTVFGFAQYPQNPISGVLGLGHGPRSLLSQLRGDGMGRMSYCIPLWEERQNTFLRFGRDARFKPRAQIRVTPFIQGPNIMKLYYVELMDISVNGNRLNFPPGTFELNHENSKGGCVLDTGSPLVLMQRDAYDVVKGAIASYFSALGGQPESAGGLDLCYARRGAFVSIDSRFPTITFKFRNADLDVKSGAFVDFPGSPGHICLAFKPHDLEYGSVIIGNQAQSNYRFLINIEHNTVSFAREDCKRDF